MAPTTPTRHEDRTSPSVLAASETNFTDSAIVMDINSPEVTPQSKPQFESDSDSVTDAPVGNILERLRNARDDTETATSGEERSRSPSDRSASSSNEQLQTSDPFLDLPASSTISQDLMTTSSPPESNPALTTHLTTTISSLRLRHQEQTHLHTIFTSKVEGLAQRSLAHESTIRALTQQLSTLRTQHAELNRSHARITTDNSDLRHENADLRDQVVEQGTAMEAMAGAVRGLEGWIETAARTPKGRTGEQHRPVGVSERNGNGHGPRPGPGPRDGSEAEQDGKRKSRQVIRGKGRFRGRYYMDDDDDGIHKIYDQNGETTETVYTEGDQTLGVGHGRVWDLELDRGRERDTAEIREGVMAWVRGFRDVEESMTSMSVNSRNGIGIGIGIGVGNRSRGQLQRNGRPPGDIRGGSTIGTVDRTLEDDFGEFESAG